MGADGHRPAHPANSPPRPTHKSDKRRLHPDDIWGMLKQTASDWMEDKAMRLAASLALYTILSLAPLLVIAVKVASVILTETDAQKRIAAEVSRIIGEQGGNAIKDMVAAAAKPGAGTWAIIISSAILLFTASNVFAELQDSLNTIWEVKPRPGRPVWNTIRERLFSLAMVFAVIFILLVSLVVSTAVLALANYLGGEGGWTSYLLDLGMSLVVIAGLFALLYRFVPDVRLEWKDVILGAVVTAALFKLGQIGLGLYFNYASPTSAYGAAGSFAAVLLWAYYSSMVFFAGAEFTQVYARRAGRWVEIEDNAVPVTEEERAQQGLPNKENVQAAAEGRPMPPEPTEVVAAPAARPPSVVVKIVREPDARTGWKKWLIGAGGVAAGALLTSIGMRRAARHARTHRRGREWA